MDTATASITTAMMTGAMADTITAITIETRFVGGTTISMTTCHPDLPRETACRPDWKGSYE
jgi:hypothetical protein